MRNLVHAIALLLVLGLSAPVLAEPFEDAMAAWKQRDYPTAMRLLRPLADQGNAYAQNDLGVRYDKGQGVPQDYAAALKWYRLAADQGVGEAQYSLGYMYAKGHGVPQDYVQAHKWYSLTAAAGSRDAIKNRNIVAGKMTPAQIAEAQKLASAWKPK